MATKKPHTITPDGRMVWRLDDHFGVVWDPLFREIKIGTADTQLRCSTDDLNLLIDTLLAVRTQAKRDRH